MEDYRLVPKRSIPTEHAFDGKEFVTLKQLLEAFGINEDTALSIRSKFSTCGMETIQKRAEKDLFQELTNKVIGKGKHEVWYSPIVTKDGWVYWTSSGHHQLMLEGLAELYTCGMTTAPDFVLRRGIAWQITSMQPNTICHGDAYKPTHDDLKIFSLFKVNVISVW